MPVLRFYVFCALGSILKMLAFAYGGNTIINWPHEMQVDRITMSFS